MTPGQPYAIFEEKWKRHDGFAQYRRERARSGVPRECGPCRRGRHDALMHDARGCLRKVGIAPIDYVCSCPKPR